MDDKQIRDKVRKEHCPTCGTQRCDRSDEWMDGCGHYKELKEPRSREGLCFRCEFRAKFLETGSGPRHQCKQTNGNVFICYMYQPVKPVILGDPESSKGDPRPRGSGILSKRHQFIKVPENMKLTYKEYGNNFALYWTLFKPTVVFDFDGVIHSYTSGWQGHTIIPDKPVRGIKKTLETLRENYEVHIFSTRCSSKEGIEAIKKWLKKHKIKVDGVSHSKPPGIVLVDDRAITFDGKPKDLIEKIKNFKPYYQK